MKSNVWYFVAAAVCAPTSPALAQDETQPSRGFCAGYGMTGCTMAEGRVAIEATPIDWETAGSRGARVDNFTIGRFALRFGVSDRVEAIAGWTPFGISDPRGGRRRSDGTGDVTLGAKVNLVNPDGSGFSVAVLPFVNLPTGQQPVGAGKWTGGVAVPISMALGHVSLRLRPEVSALPDSDGIGRHPSYTLIGGIRYGLAAKLGVVGELAAQRNDDPMGASDLRFATLLMGWNPDPEVQIEPAVTLGLNQASPDLRVRMAFMKRF